MDDAELDIDALDELLGQELMEAGEDQANQAPSKTISEQDTTARKSEDEPSSTAAIEKQLREMQEKMEMLRRQLESQKSSQPKDDSASKPSGSGSSSVPTRKRLKLVDEDIFGDAKDDGMNKEPVTSMEKSVVHSGDTDSSDDEKRYPTEAGLNKMGKSIKRSLEERKSSGFSSRPPVDTWKDTKRKGTLPLDGLDGNGVRDPYSGIRIIRPLVESTVMEARMTGRKMVKMSMVPSFVQQKKIDIDWVTVGVLVNKSPPKTSKNGKPFSIWKLTDLQDCENLVCVFLFGDVHEKHWKTSVGSVVGFLNPSVMPNKDSFSSRKEVCLSIDHPGKVMLMGTSKDFGTCKGKTRDNQPCTNVVNLSTCPYCVYHVKAEYRKMSSKRTDLQASYSGVAPSGLKQKVLKNSQVIYGGQMFMNPTREATKTLRTKDKLILSNLKVARQAEELEKSSRHAAAEAIKLRHLSSSENQAINTVASKSDFLGKALCNPGAGSRNFLRHVVHEADSTSAASSKKEMISITAKDLLKMHNGSMKSPAGASLDSKRTASTLQAKSLSAVSPISSVSAPLPRLTALTPSEIAKLRAAKKLSAKAPLVRQDPNAVKKDTTSSEVQAKIQRKLEEPAASSKVARDDEFAEMPAAKRSRLGPELTKEEVEKLLRQKSSHAHQVDDIEQEQEEQYFSVLEKKEQLEEKMLSVTEIQCDVVSCRKCNYTAQQASDLCKKENHALKHHKAMKRFFRCKDCSHRTVTFARVPAHSCRKCNGSNYERTSMGKPKPGPMLDSEKLLIRGEEIKFLNK
ncbi:protein MCM10 homolog isoform X1 [Rhipicephalus sanguineus]|uniref:protein MCM10 homolog isoform X1 n=1 Tax=Rhipicephalus sanguineus TaxID=34632 RepID=UPI001895F17B|nr:protein MCM10 homolog isoform X1 [Rhipicephalus sanguineus]